MEKTYNPHNIEQPIYKYWEDHDYFKPHGNKNKESFCIMIPPPNITGSLHMGHAFQLVLIDIMMRYQRMRGKNSLCQTGTDHAGIATQMLVERKIAAEEGKTRHDYGRDAFINKIWQWKEELSDTISYQMRRFGISIYWDYERFTMDKGISKAVKEVFVRLYKENLIYRKKRLVNWDPTLRTAISDLEVEYRQQKGVMWYIRYPLANGIKTFDNKNYLVVATTRPETMLGDVGLAVNPEDSRYKDLIGKFVILPIIGRHIPIIGDEHADIKKGTGCVKITPAHDFNDYEVGQRHGLPMINIFTFDGAIRDKAEVYDTKGNNSTIYDNAIPKEFQKLERFSARKAVIAAVSSLSLLDKTSPYDITVAYGDRSDTIIEPMLMDQWYLRISELKKPAIEAVKKGMIQFIPKHYENTYFSWMHNIKDWCISRQIWWGHRIPAWYDKKGKIYIGHNESEIRQKNNLGPDVLLFQDEDVLDTWFSSALWTFSTLGWPTKTDILRQFHPTSVIVSGFDIIFFWIARMIMITMHFIKDKNNNPQVPFRIVYVTGLIRDDKGQKMSKSKGNVIDPLDIIDGITLEELLKKCTRNMLQPRLAEQIKISIRKQFPNGIRSYGTDSLRFTLATLASTRRDINWNIKTLEGYHKFCNKLWNASRFVLMHTEKQDCGFNGRKKTLSLVDRWIISEFNHTIKKYREALDCFRFDIAATILYKFIWDQFCNWYLEFIKPFMMNEYFEDQARGIRHTLITVLESLLRLAHPIIPFITESIWLRVKAIAGIKSNDNTIMLQPFPKYDASQVDEMAVVNTEWMKQVIVSIRNIRIRMNIPPNELLNLSLRNCNTTTQNRISRNKSFLKHMAKLNSIIILSVNDQSPISFIIKIIDGVEFLISRVDCKSNKT